MNPENATPIIIYENAGHAVEVRLDARHDTVWLTQAQMAALFDVKAQNITMSRSHAPAWECIRCSLMGRSRYLSSHSTRTASCYDADGIALDSRGLHVCDYAAANRTYAGSWMRTSHESRERNSHHYLRKCRSCRRGAAGC